MPDSEEMVRLTISIPASLRKGLKVMAAKNDRSFSGEIVHCLKRGAEWSASEREAAGDEGSIKAPAASENTGGLASAGNVNHG